MIAFVEVSCKITIFHDEQQGLNPSAKRRPTRVQHRTNTEGGKRLNDRKSCHVMNEDGCREAGNKGRERMPKGGCELASAAVRIIHLFVNCRAAPPKKGEVMEGETVDPDGRVNSSIKRFRRRTIKSAPHRRDSARRLEEMN